jgi:penicillin-insensitive murein endopeptidase
MNAGGVVLAAICALAAPLALASQCYGTVGAGRIENSVKLPDSGANFSAYSTVGTALGRNYVHADVARIVVQAYAALVASAPASRYVYGETGGPHGGRFKPHRTHQNGLSVDFFVPVRDAGGAAATLPSTMGNRFGYDIEFDAGGAWGDYRIDFSALAEHLYQLDLAARARGRGLERVIIDRRYFPKLFATARGPALEKKLVFMRTEPWVRHDEHYHVDFAIPCKRLGAPSTRTS